MQSMITNSDRRVKPRKGRIGSVSAMILSTAERSGTPVGRIIYIATVYSRFRCLARLPLLAPKRSTCSHTAAMQRFLALIIEVGDRVPSCRRVPLRCNTLFLARPLHRPDGEKLCVAAAWKKRPSIVSLSRSLPSSRACVPCLLCTHCD